MYIIIHTSHNQLASNSYTWWRHDIETHSGFATAGMRYLVLGSFDRSETVKQSQDFMFDVLENYRCWRFHGSGVMQGFESVGQILLGTRMHLGHVLRLRMWFRVFLFLFENTEARPWTRCVPPRRDSSPLKNGTWVQTMTFACKRRHTFYNHMHFSYWLVFSMLDV